MAGSPLKRQRKLGVRAEDGSVIAFPRLTHPRAGLSHAEWHGFGPAEKIERLLGMSLDHAAEILSWGPVADLGAHRLHVWLQVWRVVFMVGTRRCLMASSNATLPASATDSAPSKNSRCANSAPVTRHRIVPGKPGRVPGGGLEILASGREFRDKIGNRWGARFCGGLF
jgi:hypothetical protein